MYAKKTEFIAPRYRLENRIVALFVILILLVQVAGFIAIRKAIDSNARAAIGEELAIGERVFLRLLEQNAEKLTQARAAGVGLWLSPGHRYRRQGHHWLGA